MVVESCDGESFSILGFMGVIVVLFQDSFWKGMISKIKLQRQRFVFFYVLSVWIEIRDYVELGLNVVGLVGDLEEIISNGRIIM